jgi:uncharacterized membrane protein YdbT with pleckstrin-like domain
MIQLNTTQKLSKKVLNYYLLNSFVFIVILLIVFFILPKNQMQASLVWWLDIAVPFLIVFVLLNSYLSWKFFSYTITEQSITIQSGIIFRKNKSVNFNDLANIESAFGPVLAIFGLRKVQGFTSSPGQLIISHSKNGTTTTRVPDVNIILEKGIAQEFLDLARKGDIQKVQSV